MATDYKATVFLPSTAFPMKGDLPKREPLLLERCSPTQLEALDGRMAQLMREEGAYLDSLNVLPEGDSWLMLQFSGDSKEEVDEQAHALLRGSNHVAGDDVVAVASPILRHRLIVNFAAQSEGVTVDEVIRQLVRSAAKAAAA